MLEIAISDISDPRKEGILRFHNEYSQLIYKAFGSSHNHQNWVGGYADHILETLNIARLLYKTMHEFRNLDFSLDSALIVLYFHDVEKIWLYTTGEVVNKEQFYTEELQKFNIVFSEDEMNGLKYVHGEGKDYSSSERVMCKLAAFCHVADTISARIWFDYP